MTLDSDIRQVQVIYGYIAEKVSRRVAEKFVQAHAAEQGLQVPVSPIARYWCRPAPPDSPARWILGWTGPVAVRPARPPETSKIVLA